jgi:excisionase family DNA binding protein
MPGDQKQNNFEEAAKQFISLAEAAKISGLSHDHLRRLAIEEKIQAIKIGRYWYTTEEAVLAYLAIDRRPGPKPKSEN